MNMFSKEIYNKSFVGETMKESYLDACKWLSNYVISKVELMDVVSYRFTKSSNNVPTITVTLFVSIPEEEVYEQHCRVCKEASSLFFANQEADCNWCKLRAFDGRMKRICNDKSNAVKGILNKYLEASKKNEKQTENRNNTEDDVQ